MPNANYQTGRNRENYIRDLLEQNGWNVMRSAGSKGLFDLVAHKTGFVVFIQAKPQRAKHLWKEYLQYAIENKVYVLIVWKGTKHYDSAFLTPYDEAMSTWFDDMLIRLDSYAYETSQTYLIPSVAQNH